MKQVAALVLSALIPVGCFAQTQPLEPLSWTGKLAYHAEKTYAPGNLLGFAAYAGVLQAFDSPEEWGQGAAGYGKRFGSTVAWSGIRSGLAFGLDSTMGQDPRYRPSLDKGFWKRTGHAARETILTHKDKGGMTLATWRLGSAYGAAFLSNMWYPDRLNTVGLGFLQGTETVGWDFLGNLGSEFWPDLKRKVFRRK